METHEQLSAHTVQYHASALEWVSDLEFFKVEAAFFHRLLGNYSIRLSEP